MKNVWLEVAKEKKYWADVTLTLGIGPRDLHNLIVEMKYYIFQQQKRHQAEHMKIRKKNEKSVAVEK